MRTSDVADHPAGEFVRKLARLGRFIVFVCTAGWIFPHVCTEGMDLTAIQDEHARDNR